MLFRRLSKHVADQNWMAVLIDFFIVVSGVLIGLQAQGWVENRKAKANYNLAIERLEAEFNANLKVINEVEVNLTDRLGKISQAISALQSCNDSQETKQIVNQGLFLATGTYGLRLRTTALEELVSSAPMLAQQNPEVRAKYSNLLYQINVLRREAITIEDYPLRSQIERSPLIDIEPPIQRERRNNQRTWISQRRPLSLNIPVSEACHDNDLIKSLYYWERWQSEMFAVTNVLRSEIDQVLSHKDET